jgi:hypothetical protein
MAYNKHLISHYLSSPKNKNIYQSDIFASTARFRVLCCGRRWGKTVLDVDECLKFASINLKRLFGNAFRGNTGYRQNVWYVAPTYAMAKDIAWDFLNIRLDELKWRNRTNETRLSVKLLDCESVISLKGADDPDSLRGRGLNFTALDEFADIKRKAWTEGIRPALSDRHGHALFTGTPKGFNYFQELYARGVDGIIPGWRSWQFTTIDGGYVPKDEIEQAMSDLDERTFRQEYLATFESYEGVIYYNFSRVKSTVPPQPFTMPDLHIGMDFNLNPMSAAVAEIRPEIKDGERTGVLEPWFLDEIVLPGSNTELMIATIKDKYPRKKIYVYPDPAGVAGHTSSPMGVTDIKMLEGAGFIVRYRPAHPRVKDRINAVNSKLMNMRGERHLWVAKNCKKTIDCLEKHIYKEGTSFPDKTSGYDHQNDAVGYFIDYVFPIVPYKTSILAV